MQDDTLPSLVDRSGAGSPYLTAKNSPKQGKSTHISTMKSLGLLHDLKDYICNVEMVAAEQKKELERVREEKRDIEKAVYRIQTSGEKSAFPDFMDSALADMPPKLRVVFEENKVLREKLKKYKHANQALDEEVTRRGNQLLVMDDAVTVLKKQLQACSRTPAEVEAEEDLKQQISFREARIKELEQECAVLNHKLAVDARLARQAQAQSNREKEALQRQLVVAAADLEEKDKLYRAALLEARKLARRLHPNKGVLLSSTGMSETWDSAAEGSRELSQAGNQPSLAHQQEPAVVAEPEVRMMLVVLRDETPSSEAQPVGQQLQHEELEEHQEEEQQQLVCAAGDSEAGGPPDDESPLLGDVQPEPEAQLPDVKMDAAVPEAAQEAQGVLVASSSLQRASSKRSTTSSADLHISEPKSVPYSRTQARAEQRQQKQQAGEPLGSRRGSMTGPGSGASSKRASGAGSSQREQAPVGEGAAGTAGPVAAAPVEQPLPVVQAELEQAAASTQQAEVEQEAAASAGVEEAEPTSASGSELPQEDQGSEQGPAAAAEDEVPATAQASAGDQVPAAPEADAAMEEAGALAAAEGTRGAEEGEPAAEEGVAGTEVAVLADQDAAVEETAAGAAAVETGTAAEGESAEERAEEGPSAAHEEASTAEEGGRVAGDRVETAAEEATGSEAEAALEAEAAPEAEAASNAEGAHSTGEGPVASEEATTPFEGGDAAALNGARAGEGAVAANEDAAATDGVPATTAEEGESQAADEVPAAEQVPSSAEEATPAQEASAAEVGAPDAEESPGEDAAPTAVEAAAEALVAEGVAQEGAPATEVQDPAPAAEEALEAATDLSERTGELEEAVSAPA